MAVVSDVLLLIIMLVGLLRSRQTQYGIVPRLYVQVIGAMFLPSVMNVLKLRPGLGHGIAGCRHHSRNLSSSCRKLQPARFW